MTTQPQDQAPPETPAESSPSTPGPAAKVKTRVMGWTQDVPPPSPAAETDAGDGVDVGSAARTDEPRVPRSTKSGSSRTSSPVDSPEHIEDAIRTAVLGGTEAAHEFLVHDEVAKDFELLIADDEDAHGIAEPSAQLLARRLTSGINNPDLADGIALAIAVGTYVVKQLRKLREIRTARRVGGPSLEDLAGEAGEPA